MSGIPEFNYPEFYRVAKKLRSQGFDVMNPAEIATEMDTDDYEEIIKADLKAINECTSIYLLKGWNESSGAKRELKKALELGLEITVQKG